jgi:hypothetical protein
MGIHYETDFYAWTQEQANLIRQGKFSEIDTLHIIDEIESMGRSEKRALKSRLAVLLMHLLKWQYQPTFRGVSWTITIRNQRWEIAELLEDNPSLKHWVTDTMLEAYKQARLNAQTETALRLEVFPEDCPWTFEQVSSDAFLPE